MSGTDLVEAGTQLWSRSLVNENVKSLLESSLSLGGESQRNYRTEDDVGRSPGSGSGASNQKQRHQRLFVARPVRCRLSRRCQGHPQRAAVTVWKILIFHQRREHGGTVSVTFHEGEHIAGARWTTQFQCLVHVVQFFQSVSGCPRVVNLDYSCGQPQHLSEQPGKKG